MEATCAWCEAPKQSGAICPACGADYAKAEAIRQNGRSGAAPEIPETAPDAGRVPGEPPIPVRDPQFEKTVCLFALPGMMLLALLIQVTGFLADIQRIFFAMPIHELGHAITGWLCGFNAIPTLWKTLTPADRGYWSSLMLLAGLVALARYGLRHRQPAWLAAVGIVLALQIYGTWVISLSRADMYITLGGDAMGMILATALMALFYVGKDTQLYRGRLRWGFLGIGAAAFFNMFMPWWNRDMAAIGYGLTGGEPTDAWKMINIHHWDWDFLFNTQITLGLACLAFLAIVYALGLKQANLWMREHARQGRLAPPNDT